MVLVTNLPPPTEGRCVKQTETRAVIGDRDLGPGCLYVSESRVVWIGDHGNGFSLEYQAIALHALSRDLSNFPEECLYLMIDVDIGGSKEIDFGLELSSRLSAACSLELNPTQGCSTLVTSRHLDNQTLETRALPSQNGTGDVQNLPVLPGPDIEADAVPEEEETTFTEIRFVPRDKNSLDSLFLTLSEFQALHPNDSDSFSDEDEEEEELVEDEFLSQSVDEVLFDEDGQVIVDRQMRGVGGAPAPQVDVPQNTLNGGEDSYAMETGQFDDPIENDNV
ncbi:unnamed protein product [Soboliphyme baturini]|uniref:Methylosome subunit pICln n=1 Tax=Soboliphyme baturini TaxID=241478 RepID=A0A183IWE2_9BILA|nr:unnamed protein product [Soboliphyme baturini]